MIIVDTSMDGLSADDELWFMMIHGDSWWLMVIYDDYNGDEWWRMMINDDWWSW